MSIKFAVIVFPGSNCDHDAYHAAKHVLGHEAEFIWHKETSLKGADVVILPGGFSYGDYLRCGAIARFSPVMESVVEFAREGKPVIGIINTRLRDDRTKARHRLHPCHAPPLPDAVTMAMARIIGR